MEVTLIYPHYMHIFHCYVIHKNIFIDVQILFLIIMKLANNYTPGLNQLSSYHVATISVNKIFEKSNNRIQYGSTTAANHSWKIHCESSPQGRRAAESHQQSTRTMDGVVQCSANYIPLSPISFLERAAEVYSDRISVVYGSIKYTWEETHCRCVKLASALNKLGISRGDIVSIFAS